MAQRVSPARCGEGHLVGESVSVAMRLANQPHAKVLMASTSESGPGGAGMLTVLVDVTATVGSPAATRPGDGAAEMNSSPATRWPVGWGSVCDTLTEDGEPAEALVLMPEPALPG